jgi:hypothetical protein
MALGAALILSACGSIANTAFDPIEASRYSDIMGTASKIQRDCSRQDLVKAQLPALQTQTELAFRYSSVKLNNQRLTDAASLILEQVEELNTRYSTFAPSTSYCNVKLAQISVSAELIAKSIGKKELPTPIVLPLK